MGSWDPYVAPDRYACACHQHWVMVYDAPCSVRLKMYVRSSMHQWMFIYEFLFPNRCCCKSTNRKSNAPYWLILTLAYHFPLFIDFCFNLRAVVTYKSHGFWCRFGLCQAGILNVFRLRQGPCPGPVPSMSRSCLTHVTVMVQSGCSRFLLLQ